MSTVVFFHAHPDDEAIATGGTMAGLSAAGHRVVLVTATRGELGEVPEGFLAEGERLGDRRSTELAEAARLLGVHRLEFLGYEDSGMEGEDSASRLGCFATADVDEASSRLAGMLTEESADVLVVYDEHGGYGHPDHVQVHVTGMRAAELAGTRIVYLTTMDRDFMRALRTQAAELAAAADESESGWAPSEDELEGTETMGEPGERITTEVDVRPWITAKRDAMAAHASQIAEESFFLAMPEEMFSHVWGQEWFIRIRPEPVGLGDGHREAGLLVDADGTLAGGASKEG